MRERTAIVRIGLLALILSGVFFGYLYKLMQMQIVQGEEYLRRAQQGAVRTQVEHAARGEIVDRYGRPLAINRSGFDVVFDGAYMPRGQENEIITRLIALMEDSGEEWTDNLPITKTQPFAFIEGYDSEIARLKSFLNLQEYATCDDVMHWLTETYQLQSYDPVLLRKLAGVRYEMSQRGYSISVSYTFAKDIDITTVTRVKERTFEMQGVDVVESAIREYVSGDIAPHIIGQIGPIYREEYLTLKDKGYQMDDVIGKDGIEKYFEDQLRGVDGERQITLDSRGNVVEIRQTKAPQPGNTVVLTLDRDLQRVAQTALENQIKKLQQTAKEGEGREADAGAAVVIEVKTGDILAAATYPSYDINNYRSDYSRLSTDPLNPLWNRALNGLYAAGSTYKPSVALAGLAEGIVNPSSTVHCGGVYTFYAPGYSPTCLNVHGPINVLNALRVSCNIYFYDVGRRLGIENINKYSAQLGLGQPTGIEIGEKTGQLSSPQTKEKIGSSEPWYPGDVLQSAIGQLYNEFTPLQLANYAATIGNRGKRMDINILKSIKNYSFTETVQDNEPRVAQVVDAPASAFETVVQGMVMASGPGGTSYYWLGDYNSGNYPYVIASKTGTPQTSEFPNSTYICFAPAEDPQIAIAVVIEKGWHGYTGAPVAKELFDAYFFSGSGSDIPQPMGQILP